MEKYLGLFNNQYPEVDIYPNPFIVINQAKYGVVDANIIALNNNLTKSIVDNLPISQESFYRGIESNNRVYATMIYDDGVKLVEYTNSNIKNYQVTISAQYDDLTSSYFTFSNFQTHLDNLINANIAKEYLSVEGQTIYFHDPTYINSHFLVNICKPEATAKLIDVYSTLYNNLHPFTSTTEDKFYNLTNLYYGRHMFYKSIQAFVNHTVYTDITNYENIDRKLFVLLLANAFLFREDPTSSDFADYLDLVGSLMPDISIITDDNSITLKDLILGDSSRSLLQYCYFGNIFNRIEQNSNINEYAQNILDMFKSEIIDMSVTSTDLENDTKNKLFNSVDNLNGYIGTNINAYIDNNLDIIKYSDPGTSVPPDHDNVTELNLYRDFLFTTSVSPIYNELSGKDLITLIIALIQELSVDFQDLDHLIFGTDSYGSVELYYLDTNQNMLDNSDRMLYIEPTYDWTLETVTSSMNPDDYIDPASKIFYPSSYIVDLAEVTEPIIDLPFNKNVIYGNPISLSFAKSMSLPLNLHNAMKDHYISTILDHNLSNANLIVQYAFAEWLFYLQQFAYFLGIDMKLVDTNLHILDETERLNLLQNQKVQLLQYSTKFYDSSGSQPMSLTYTNIDFGDISGRNITEYQNDYYFIDFSRTDNIVNEDLTVLNNVALFVENDGYLIQQLFTSVPVKQFSKQIVPSLILFK